MKNPAAIEGLVLLDTWVGNPDRFPRRPRDPSLSSWTRENKDNVLLAALPKNRRRLLAMDFSVCLYCRGGGLRSSYDERCVRDDGIYGLFPEFEPFVTEAHLRPFLARLGNAEQLRLDLPRVLDRIPGEWHVDDRTRAAVRHLLSSRATYLADNFLPNLQRALSLPLDRA